MRKLTPRTIRRRVAASTAIAALAVACTTPHPSGPSHAGYTPRFASTRCPGAVTASSTREMRCGYVTVPEDRSNPSGRTVRVFVVRLEPTHATTAPPVIFAGDHLGYGFDYVGISGMADHLDGPEVIAVQPRGTGYSEPNLACPEVDATAPLALRDRIDDPGLRSAFLGAVRACHDRFASQGIDPSDFDVEEAGADLVDVVRALGIGRWDVITKGTTSRILFSAMRAHPAGLRSVVAYDPEFPGTDPFREAFTATRDAVAELSELCSTSATCASAFPDLVGSFEAALRRFDAHPETIRIEDRRIVVDGARLLRGLRNLLGTIAADEQTYRRIPATIDALANAEDPTETVEAVIAPELRSSMLCTGYLPVCGSLRTKFSQGAYYSAICADVQPFTDDSTLPSLARASSAWSKDYVASPYEGLCGAWAVDPADRAVTAAVRSDIPMLVFSGGLDPYVSPGAVRAGLQQVPNAFLVVLPVMSAPVVGVPACPDEQPRNEFLADPSTAPTTSCQVGFRPRFLHTPL